MANISLYIHITITVGRIKEDYLHSLNHSQCWMNFQRTKDTSPNLTLQQTSHHRVCCDHSTFSLVIFRDACQE